MSISLGSKNSPTRLIIEHLQRHGSATIKEMEGVLGVTTTAVRQQIGALLEQGYVQRNAVVDGVGRPHHTYSSTQKSHELFACHCDDLALTLLQEVFEVEGTDRAQYLLGRVGNRLAERYGNSVHGETLQERVAQMATGLEARGVLTEVEFDAQPWEFGEHGSITLKTYNCPYHELAQVHREVCDMDEQVIAAVIGAPVTLSSCIMDGAQSCTFRVATS